MRLQGCCESRLTAEPACAGARGSLSGLALWDGSKGSRCRSLAASVCFGKKRHRRDTGLWSHTRNARHWGEMTQRHRK